MESRYFKRDISWLSFNYRVLLEAEDDTLPLYERINFISIYSSNLEEFYKIRVADHKAIATGAAHSDEESVQSAMQLVSEINEEVNRQLEERIRIYEQKILPALRQQHIIFYQSRNVEPFHKEFLRKLLPGGNLSVSLSRTRQQGQGNIVPARQPPVPCHTTVSERRQGHRGTSKQRKNSPILRDEAALQQSTPLHRAAQAREELLPDVHRGHHQSQYRHDIPRL